MTGATEIAVGDEGGQVVLRFPQAVEWCTLDPETARQVGEAIARAAYHAHTGQTVDPKQFVLSEQVRTRLITRVSHVIRSLQDKGRLPGFIAAEVVDTVLQEVK
jgi:hypothetical protein